MIQSWRTSRKRKPNFNKKDISPYPATKFFDQLSFLGDENVGCFVWETEQGYILIDCMNPDQRSITMIEQGFQDLGFEIEKLYAILITHGHGDHFGNAGYFKEKYHTRIYMSQRDYEFAKDMPSYFPWDPINFEVDYFFRDEEVLHFGQSELCTIFTPGHSPGCCSFILSVSDEGREHRLALWGGSGILPDTNQQDYYRSLLKFSKLCGQYHVDGEIATHPCLDLGIERLNIIRNIVDGVPNPFVLGVEGYHYYEQQFYDLVKNAGKGSEITQEKE